MKNIRETFLKFSENEDIKKDIKELLMKPIFNLIYNEIYLYLWIIALYNVFFIFIILAILFVLLNMRKQSIISSTNIDL
jgi:hypothetical protein